MKDHPGYEVSDLGRIRSSRRTIVKILRLGQDKDGYQQVRLDRRTRRVHHLVLESFGSPRPLGAECRHLDGDKRNNRPSNLAWGTSSENGSDKTLHGSHRGARNGRARFSEVEVLQIRADLASGETHASVAKRLGVPVGTVEDIGRGRSWPHLGGEVQGRQLTGRPQRITQAQVDAVLQCLQVGTDKRATAKTVGVSAWTVHKIASGSFKPRKAC